MLAATTPRSSWSLTRWARYRGAESRFWRIAFVLTASFPARVAQDVLDNAYKGFNASLFAYGQTGSGKSYSMVGYGVNKGIVPMTCDSIFAGIRTNSSDKMSYQVTLQMLEIYNEQVRDLLSKTPSPKGGLKVRQHPKLGVQVVGLSEVAVGSFEEINKRIESGTSQRTVAATNMNATSSRAHTVVTMLYTQVEKDGKGPGKNKEVTSKINLVDLAGSERADSTGATGDRLKEGSAINLSLTMLGNVIKALAEKSNNPKSRVLVPYRDSKLTQILQDALGGNSKTIMIAALSPADINYEETLSTLRYADRAKQIKNKAIINVDPTEILISQLKEENAKLMTALKAGGGSLEALGKAGGTPAEVAEMKEKLRAEMEAELLENQRMMEEQNKSWEEKLKDAQSTFSAADQEKQEMEDRKANTAHLLNLNEDPALSGHICHFVAKGAGQVTIGRRNATPTPDIVLGGLGIAASHAVLLADPKSGAVSVQAVGNAKTLVNGQQVAAGSAQALKHHDRVLFGNNHMFIFHDPAGDKAAVAMDWEAAQEEIMKAQGLGLSADEAGGDMSNMTPEQIQKRLVDDAIIKMLPLVNEANLISDELQRKVRFDLKLVGTKGSEQVISLVTDEVTGSTWTWDREKMLNRSFLMREMYNDVQEGGELPPDDKDPFFEPAGEELIGYARLQLKSLAYKLESEETLDVVDFKGDNRGQLRVELLPCDAKGNHEDFDEFVEDPSELVGQSLHFLARVVHARGLPKQYQTRGYLVRFRVMTPEADDPEKGNATPLVKDTFNPEFNFSHQYSFPSVTQSLRAYLENEELIFGVYGMQRTREEVLGGGAQAAKSKANAAAAANVAEKTAAPAGNSSALQSQLSDAQKEILSLKEKLKQLPPHEQRGGDQVPTTARRAQLQEKVASLERQVAEKDEQLASVDSAPTPRRAALEAEVAELKRARAELEAKGAKLARVEAILAEAKAKDDGDHFTRAATALLGQPLEPAKKGGCLVL